MSWADWFTSWSSALPAGDAAPPVKIGKATITPEGVRALYDVARHLVTGTAGVKDGEAIAEIAINAALTAAGPEVAALAAPIADALACLIIEDLASGKLRISPGAPGEGQTRMARGGRVA